VRYFPKNFHVTLKFEIENEIVPSPPPSILPYQKNVAIVPRDATPPPTYEDCHEVSNIPLDISPRSLVFSYRIAPSLPNPPLTQRDVGTVGSRPLLGGQGFGSRLQVCHSWCAKGTSLFFAFLSGSSIDVTRERTIPGHRAAASSL